MSSKVPDTVQIASPCTSICVIDPPTGLCAGCYRTLDEIAAWIGLSTGERRALVAELTQRRERYGEAIASRWTSDAQR
jgi:predicted Fe-S protein YdhL (DUF1289 family)